MTVTVPDHHLNDAIDRLVRQGVEGIVVMAPIVGEIDTLPDDVPIVVTQAGTDIGRSAVAIDQATAARQVTQHLLDQGAPTVWHLAGPDDWHEAHIEGWHTALTAAGADVPEVLWGDWSAASGHELGRYLAARTDVDAVFVANDQMALGLLHAFRDAGVDVPGRALVAGFDDVPEARFFAPSLTTVLQDFAEVGRQAIRLLTEELDGAGPRPQAVLVPAELVIRESSTRPTPGRKT